MDASSTVTMREYSRAPGKVENVHVMLLNMWRTGLVMMAPCGVPNGRWKLDFHASDMANNGPYKRVGRENADTQLTRNKKYY